MSLFADFARSFKQDEIFFMLIYSGIKLNNCFALHHIMSEMLG